MYIEQYKFPLKPMEDRTIYTAHPILRYLGCVVFGYHDEIVRREAKDEKEVLWHCRFCGKIMEIREMRCNT